MHAMDLHDQPEARWEALSCCVWVKKYHEDAINRVVLTVDSVRLGMIRKRIRYGLSYCVALFSHAEGKQLKIGASGSKLEFLPDGRNLSWQTPTPALQHFCWTIMYQSPSGPWLIIFTPSDQTDHGPDVGNHHERRTGDSISWVKVDLRYFWQYELVDPIWDQSRCRIRRLYVLADWQTRWKCQRNSYAAPSVVIAVIQEFEMPEEELKRKQQIMNTPMWKCFFTLITRDRNFCLPVRQWLGVGGLFPVPSYQTQKKAKNKAKANKSETQNIKTTGVMIMELGIMVCIVLLLSLAGCGSVTRL